MDQAPRIEPEDQAIKDHLTLRTLSRDTLWRLGVPNNPLFTEHNILSGLRRGLDLPPLTTDEAQLLDESTDLTDIAQVFRSQLTAILELDPSAELAHFMIKLDSL